MTAKEAVAHLNGLNVTQSGWPEEDYMPADVAMTGIVHDSIVSEDLDPDEHRWYVTSVTVYKVLDGFIGCRLVSMMRGEGSGISDIEWSYHWMEMEEVQTTSYVEKA
jgi:hypothetical protein